MDFIGILRRPDDEMLEVEEEKEAGLEAIQIEEKEGGRQKVPEAAILKLVRGRIFQGINAGEALVVSCLGSSCF